jgi:hypothetical protein
MYGMLTADIFGCVAFSLPVQRRNSQDWEFQRFPFPSKASAVRGSGWNGSRVGGGPVPGYHSRYRDGSDSDVTHYPFP